MVIDCEPDTKQSILLRNQFLKLSKPDIEGNIAGMYESTPFSSSRGDAKINVKFDKVDSVNFC